MLILGSINNGLDELNIHLIPCLIVPGAASGIICPGHKYPALTYEAPESKEDLSIIVTL